MVLQEFPNSFQIFSGLSTHDVICRLVASFRNQPYQEPLDSLHFEGVETVCIEAYLNHLTISCPGGRKHIQRCQSKSRCCKQRFYEEQESLTELLCMRHEKLL